MDNSNQGDKVKKNLVLSIFIFFAANMAMACGGYYIVLPNGSKVVVMESGLGTNQSGIYRLSIVNTNRAACSYTVRVEAQGFTTQNIPNVQYAMPREGRCEVMRGGCGAEYPVELPRVSDVPARLFTPTTGGDSA